MDNSQLVGANNTQPETPLVSLIAVCYNHEKYVLECLEGIRSQTYTNVQLIIMDDCSKDNSVAVIQNWIEETGINCLFISHDYNMGLIKTLNEAILVARGKYVSLISTDDVWLPEFIEDHVNIFETYGESVGVVYGRSYTLDENGNRLQELLPSKNPPPEGDVLCDLLCRNFILANTVMIRRSCYDRVGYYDEELIGEGFDLWLRIARFYQFKFSPRILSLYRILPSSLSHSNMDQVRITKTKVYLKQLDQHTRYMSLIYDNLIGHRDSLYRMGHPLAKKYLWLGLLKKPSKTDLLMTICAFLGLPYSAYLKFFRFLTRQTHAL